MNIYKNISKCYVSSRLSTVLPLLLFLLVTLLMPSCSQEKPKKELSLGDIAPDFALKDLRGEVFVLSNMQGSPVILRFFESDCRFCKADTPAFNKFYTENRVKGLKIIYVGSFYEDEKALRNFVEELGTTFPVAMDKDGRLADTYNVLGYPQTLFIGPQRQILAAILGGVGEAELQEILGKYL